jgi:putative transposase
VGKVPWMSATLNDVTKKNSGPSAEAEAAKELVRLAKEQGLSLAGPDGLLKQFTKSVLETALGQATTLPRPPIRLVTPR